MAYLILSFYPPVFTYNGFEYLSAFFVILSAFSVKYMGTKSVRWSISSNRLLMGVCLSLGVFVSFIVRPPGIKN